MPAERIHLVRHGEVFNPDGVLYGRIPGYHLSELGHQMADAAAASLAGRDLRRLVASPLQRTQESAAPWAKRTGLAIETDERLIEPWNRFEGTRVCTAIRSPKNWPLLINPGRPSWGEPFGEISARMMAAVADAHASVEAGEVVLVSHQLPIWMVARTVARKALFHDPRTRRCTLSSITTLEWRDGLGGRPGVFVEVDYQEPAAELLAKSTDLGAV